MVKPSRRTAYNIFGIVFSVYIMTTGGSFATDLASYEVTKNLVQQGSVAMSYNVLATAAERGVDGRYYAPVGLGHPVFGVPFYFASRVGKNNQNFTMVKLRSMVVNADKSGVDSTSGNDQRITGVGKFIRKCKLDEISQLWNVLIGDMSLVGPRPNVQRETDLYSSEEKGLLSVKMKVSTSRP